MEFRVLGPLEILDEGRPLHLPGAKQRALLAILLLHANQVVSTDRLLDSLWGDELPESGATALQVRVSQLRKALGAGGAAIVTHSPGYLIELSKNALDLHVFERLAVDADRALQREDPTQAWTLLEQALALWRGPALADFTYEPFAQAAIARLEELRLVAQERRIEAGLRLGRHIELVPALETLVAAHPLREGLRRQLMLALYRSGRQAEALDAYQAARRTLVDELGIEPGHPLQELERAILSQDRSLDVAPVQAPSRAILAAALDVRELAPLLPLAEPLARRPTRELILATVPAHRDSLASAAAETNRECETLTARGLVARAAVFTSSAPGFDVARLAREQDVDLVLVGASSGLDDPALTEILRYAPCDVAAVVGDPVAEPGPVLVPFTGGEHDWAAVEVGAWLAGSWKAPLRLAGPTVDGARDSSRLLASASLAVQRALGVAAEPVLVDPERDALAHVAQEVAASVVGLPEQWRTAGLGAARASLARSGRPVLLVRKGLRPGGLSPPENLTRFTWSLRSP
jgi:DNA-binding SARP family transcriptional activator